MPLTADERSAINRRNARKSTGPRTDEGKAASRRNATKHGLRAVALALPNEDPAAVAARSDAWNDYYRPQSPAAQHLVNACVAATLLSDRCQNYHLAAVAKQVREAGPAWEAARADEVAAAVALLPTRPAAAVRRLERTGHGCRWLIARWEDLRAALDARGWLTGPERDDAVRLQGLELDQDTIQASPQAWLTVLHAATCRETPAASNIHWLFQPDRVPDLYRGVYTPENLPLPAESLRALRTLAAAHLAAARVREAAHREGTDDPDRDEAADRALILHDGPSARLFLRYHAEARTAFNRAYGSLVKALERDAALDTEAEADAPAVSPNEPNAPEWTPDEPPPTPAESVPPNEPDSAPAGEANPGEVERMVSEEELARNYDLILQAVSPRTRTKTTGRDDDPKPARQRLVG